MALTNEQRELWQRLNSRRLAVSTERPRATCYSYLVAPGDQYTVETRGRLAMIADGRAPGTVVHTDADPDGSGLTEVVISHRPLRAGETFNHTGRRVGTGGTRSTGY